MTISKKLIKQMNEYYGSEYIKVEENKPEDGKLIIDRCQRHSMHCQRQHMERIGGER